MVISVPIGLAGALFLTRLHFKARDVLYALLVSPILTPGIILGISNFLFCDTWFHIACGLWTAIMGQSTFISAYCMLLIMARSQRFDQTQEEAAFDLGATHQQVFWKITLPFLKPAIISSAVLSLMKSFKNYNTTLFAIGFEQTLPIYIGTKLRVFISPAMNALAVIFIVLTVTGAILYEARRLREGALKKPSGGKASSQAMSAIGNKCLADVLQQASTRSIELMPAETAPSSWIAPLYSRPARWWFSSAFPYPVKTISYNVPTYPGRPRLAPSSTL